MLSPDVPSPWIEPSLKVSQVRGCAAQESTAQPPPRTQTCCPGLGLTPSYGGESAPTQNASIPALPFCALTWNFWAVTKDYSFLFFVQVPFSQL